MEPERILGIVGEMFFGVVPSQQQQPDDHDHDHKPEMVQTQTETEDATTVGDNYNYYDDIIMDECARKEMAKWEEQWDEEERDAAAILVEWVEGEDAEHLACMCG